MAQRRKSNPTYRSSPLPILTTRLLLRPSAVSSTYITPRHLYQPYPPRRDVLPGSYINIPFPYERRASSPLSEPPDETPEQEPKSTRLERLEDMPASSLSDLSSEDGELITLSGECDGLISKPGGEAGRKNAGRGYDFEKVLGWPEKDEQELKVSCQIIMLLLKTLTRVNRSLWVG